MLTMACDTMTEGDAEMAQRDYILRLIEELGAALIALRNAIIGGGAPAAPGTRPR